MIKVTLVGKGNVSTHLKKVIEDTTGIHLIDVLSSRRDALNIALKNERQDTPDLYIIAVSDDAIASVSQKLAVSKKLVVHTSGSVSMNVLPEGVRRGAFYPLQTFSKGRKVDFKTIPICIEAEKQEDLQVLRKLAELISDSVYEVSSEQRRSLHLAAVFVNNFTNHIYQIGNEICEKNGVSFDILKPLIAETAKKINSLPPIGAQTGPAKRNDDKTIESHLKQLKNKTHNEVYQMLTKSIKETYGEEL